MNRKMMLSAAAAMSAFAAFAASTVSDVVARQRWPWSETVDIDYTLTGDKCDVDFLATWDGQATPVIIGTDFQVEAGQHRFEWCPTNSYAGQTLTGFTVTATSATFADHKYLVVDLANGGYSFLSAPPEGGWTSEHKSTKMVFARCPAGVYNNGIASADYQFLANNTTYSTSWGTHTTTFTSDWYIGLFNVSEAQYNQIVTGTAGSSYAAKTLSYDKWRGATNDTPSVNWPSTKYAVTSGTVVDKLRKLAGGALCVDLPTEEQFESALRGGTSTFWPSGGARTDSFEVLTNYVNAVANWYYTSGYSGSSSGPAVVGYYCNTKTNAFGICDIAGFGAAAVCLDTVIPSGNRRYPSRNAGSSTDPVGFSYPSGSEYLRRVVKGGAEATSSASLWAMLPCARDLGDATSAGYSTRFAIHLKPLHFND